eukprot:g4125.t1
MNTSSIVASFPRKSACATPMLELFVRTPISRSSFNRINLHVLRVSKECSCRELKALAASKVGIDENSFSNCRVLNGGREIRDDAHLFQCTRITQRSTLDIVPRLNGGKGGAKLRLSTRLGEALQASLSVEETTSQKNHLSTGGDGGAQEEFKWSNFVSSPTNIAILVALLTVALVAIYCLVKLVLKIINWFWVCMLRTPCCLGLKWVWVPCCKSLRVAIYECKQACHNSCIACDECCHPWKKMEIA